MKMLLAGGGMARIILGAIGGGLAGFAWQRFVGCRTGTCPLMSNPYISTLYGALMGLMLAWR